MPARPVLVRLGPPAYRTQPPAPTPAPAITAQEGAKAKALLDRVVAAKGGLEKLRGIKTIVAVTSSTAQTPQGPVEAQTTTTLAYPNRARIETQMPKQGSQVQVYDGERAWVRDPMGVHDLDATFARQFEAGLKHDTITLLVAAADGSVRARVLPDVKDETGTLHHALELSSSTLEPIILYVAPATGLIAKQTYVAGGTGQPLIEERFSDYRPVDGVQVAFTASVFRGGRRIVERTVTDIKINTPLDPALFKRPSS